MDKQSATNHGHPVYFLLHVPKTAGRTIQVHLANHCAPGVFWQSSPGAPLARRAHPHDLPDPSRARVIAGHYITKSLENLFCRREIRRILLLREPLEFQVSYYNWQMMDNIAKGLGTYSLDLHLRSLPPNFIAVFLLTRWLEIPWRMLLGMTDEQKYSILNRMLARFWFVGEHTDCDRLIEAIAPSLGVPPSAPRRNTASELQAQTGWRLVTAASLPQSFRCLIRARNRLDQALWECWRKAGFEAAAIRPPPLEWGGKGRFSVDEIVRPWFKLGRFVRSRRGLWLRRTNPGIVSLALADRARDAGQWELAARYYRAALCTLPNGPGIWVQYGHALKETGKLAEAERSYRQALRLRPDSADTHLQLGHVLKLQGEIEQAKEAYQHSVRLDPDYCHARDELISLGWTADGIEQMIATAAMSGSHPHSEAS